MSPQAVNIYDVSYVRCNPSRYSAARLVRYLCRRPRDKERPGRESGWYTLPKDRQFGDVEAFKREADRRRRERVASARQRGKDIGQDHSPKNVSYLHIVISPSRREDFENEDFGALIDPWVRDRNGKPCPYYAVIHHDDPEGPKLHLGVARDRIHKTKELPRLKELTHGIINEREMMLQPEREPEPEREHVCEPEREPAREPKSEFQRNPETEPEPKPGPQPKPAPEREPEPEVSREPSRRRRRGQGRRRGREREDERDRGRDFDPF